MAERDEGDLDAQLRMKTGRSGRWRWLSGVGAVIVIAIATVGWVQVPNLYTGVQDEAARTQAIVTTRASVLAALAGLGALATIGINYRNSLTNARTLATTQQTFRVTERGHLTDRYAKAIEQLGNEDSIAIRLGGIYALQQLAVDTSRDSDQATVVEVLSAFVRLNLRVDLTSQQVWVNGRPTTLARPRADVVAAVSVLAQLPDRAGAPMRADFAELDFAGISLTQARLTGANLTRVTLGKVSLADTNLSEANLHRTILSGADLSHSKLAQANLTSAVLRNTILSSVNLTRANLIDALMEGSDLTDADLTDAELTGADFTGANLAGANLTNANVEGAAGLRNEQIASMAYRPDGLPGTPRTPRHRPRNE